MSYKYLPGMLTRREREVMKLLQRERYTTKCGTYSKMVELTPPRGSTKPVVRVQALLMDRLVQYGRLKLTRYYTEKHHIPFWVYELKW